MSLPKDHLRHVLFYEYKKGNNVATALKNIREIYGQDIISGTFGYGWYKAFKSGTRGIKSQGRQGRPPKFESAPLLALLEEDNSLTVKQIAQRLNQSTTTVHNHLKKLGRVSKNGKWVLNHASKYNSSKYNEDPDEENENSEPKNESPNEENESVGSQLELENQLNQTNNS